MDVAGATALALFAVVAVFQLMLAAGAPWGAAAWGGGHPGVLPARLRVASGLTGAVVYPLLALYVIAAAGWAGLSWLPGPRVAMWVLFGFFTLGILTNGMSRSPIERIWAPVNLALAVCCLVLALGG